MADVIHNRITAAGLTGLALIGMAVLFGTSIERSPTPDRILYVKMYCRGDAERDCLVPVSYLDEFLGFRINAPKVHEVRAPKPPAVTAPEFEVSAPKPGEGASAPD